MTILFKGEIAIKVQEAITAAIEELKQAGITSNVLDARLLLEYVLDASREELVRNPARVLLSEDVEFFRELVKQRAGGEPVAKIIGFKEFWGLAFKTTKDTLDPRPDSETLIEAVLKYFKDKNKKYRFLDFGTGGGCLLLALLYEYPNATGVGIDISFDAMEVAKENADALGLRDRCTFVFSSWGEGISGKFDLIISNPPYIKTADIPSLAPEVSIFDPYVALDGGEDGLKEYRNLAYYLPELLEKGGYVMLEIGAGQGSDVENIITAQGLTSLSREKDLTGTERCLVARY